MDIYDWLKVVNDPDDDGLQMIVKIAIRLLCRSPARHASGLQFNQKGLCFGRIWKDHL